MMNDFNNFFKFGTLVKLKASLYTIAILFFLCISNLFLGVTVVKIFSILQIFVASIVVAIIEYVCFCNYDNLSKSKRNRNTAIWVASANIIFISSALAFQWFADIPTWAGFVLIFMLEGGLVALRYSIYLMNKADTKNLNEGLQKFQNKQ